jgi:hypothetical protein
MEMIRPAYTLLMVIGQPLMKHERKKTMASGSAIWLCLCVMILWLAVGCAATPSRPLSNPPQPTTLEPAPGVYGWWSVRFKMDRPDGKTKWERDLLIAHRVTFPIIGAHGEAIDLWRFHRRSGDDETGHQFSFLFFSTAEVADTINRMVVDDPLVEQLLADGVIQEVITDAVDHNDHPHVGDTSDRKWSPVMKDTWPYYIMGVSRMWLGMIDQISLERELAADATTSEMLEHYVHVNDAINRIWQQEGYHALLHHLNAIYGYEALIYWEKRWKTF